MALKLVEERISIKAPAEKIWQIITCAEYNTVWLAAFGKGMLAKTDWHQGSNAIFSDDSQTGLVAKIRESRPFEKILMQNIGMIKNGKEDLDSPAARESRDFFEQYLLIPESGSVRMQVKVVVQPQLYKKVSNCWQKALVIIKKLAENIH